MRRECLDRLLIFGEAHLRRVLASYAAYYNQVRMHLALGKDAPLGRAVQRSGVIVAIPKQSIAGVSDGGAVDAVGRPGRPLVWFRARV